MNNKIKIGAYFYPLTNNCRFKKERAKENGIKKLADETLLVQQAKPLFKDHNQPRIFCLGGKDTTRWDDSNPKSMEKQIELSLKYGIDFFIFDSYIGAKQGRVVKEVTKPINVFLNSNKSNSLKFAFMFCSGSPRVFLPSPKEKNYSEPRHYDINRQTAQVIIDYCAKNYWDKENYLKIKGRPYISACGFIHSKAEGSFREMLEELKSYSIKTYKIEPYLVGVAMKAAEAPSYIAAGADAITGYALLPDFGSNDNPPTALPIQNYDEQAEKRIAEWEIIKNNINDHPFIPPSVVGWDASPRGENNCGYKLADVSGIFPYTPIINDSSPKKFGNMFKKSIEFIRKNVAPNEQYAVISSWNEITEGNALLPEIIDGQVNFDYLETLKKCVENLNDGTDPSTS